MHFHQDQPCHRLSVPFCLRPDRLRAGLPHRYSEWRYSAWI